MKRAAAISAALLFAASVAWGQGASNLGGVNVKKGPCGVSLKINKSKCQFPLGGGAGAVGPPAAGAPRGGSGGITALANSVELATSLYADDEVWVRNAGSTLGVADTFTVAAWVKMTAGGSSGLGDRVVFGIGDASTTIPFSNGAWVVQPNSTFQEFQVVSKSTADGTPSTPIFSAGARLDQFIGVWSQNVWSLVAIAADGTADTLRFNFNGSDVAPGFSTGTLEAFTDGAGRALFLGHLVDAVTTGAPPARIAALGLWDVELTALEISDLYAGGTPAASADWREAQGANYGGTAAGNLNHYYRQSSSGSFADFQTDLVGSLTLSVTDSTGPDDTDVVADAP